jgi:hypothetical protein
LTSDFAGVFEDFIFLPAAVSLQFNNRSALIGFRNRLR